MSQEGAQVENVAVATQEVLRITISDVLGLLAEGKSRKEIAEHYGRTQSDMIKMVWGHPKLKNRKAKKQYTGIELEDDTEDVIAGEVNDQITDAVTQEVAHVPGPEAVEAFVETPAELVNGEMVGSTDTSDWN
jgi:uncharacterized protein (DUF433 family)